MNGRSAVRDELLLHVQRDVDQHRSGPALAGDPEGLAEDPGSLGRLFDLHGPFGDRLGDIDDVDRLEGLLVELG
jgi:hypothetical protein